MFAECCSTSHHRYMKIRPRPVILVAWRVALAWHPRTRSLQGGSNSAPVSAWQADWLLHTSLRPCQQMTFVLCQSTSPDSTTSPVQYFWSSGLLCCRSVGLEFTTGQSPWPGAQQWLFLATVEEELILALPLSTHSAVEMLYDSVLYKFMIDIDRWKWKHILLNNKTIHRLGNYSVLKIALFILIFQLQFWYLIFSALLQSIQYYCIMLVVRVRTIPVSSIGYRSIPAVSSSIVCTRVL